MNSFQVILFGFSGVVLFILLFFFINALILTQKYSTIREILQVSQGSESCRAVVVDTSLQHLGWWFPLLTRGTKKCVTLLSFPGKICVGVLEKRVWLAFRPQIHEEQCWLSPGTGPARYPCQGPRGGMGLCPTGPLVICGLGEDISRVPCVILRGLLQNYGVLPALRWHQFCSQLPRTEFLGAALLFADDVVLLASSSHLRPLLKWSSLSISGFCLQMKDKWWIDAAFAAMQTLYSSASVKRVLSQTSRLSWS